MLKKLLFAAFSILFLLVSPLFGQKKAKVEKSIFVEYAFVDIAEDDAMGQMMYKNQKISVYVDQHFSVIKTWSSDAEPNTFAAMINSIVRDNKTGKAMHYMQLGELKMTDGQPVDDEKAAELFGSAFSDPTYEFKKAADTPAEAAGFRIEKWTLEKPEMTTGRIWMTDGLEFSMPTENVPMIVRRDGKTVGFCLGKDEGFGDQFWKQRAQKVVIDEPQDAAAEFASFKTMTKDEINEALKKAMGF